VFTYVCSYIETFYYQTTRIGDK